MSPDRRVRGIAASVRDLVVLAGALTLSLPGCAPAPAPPAGPGAPRAAAAQPARPKPGYDARRDPLTAVDATALAGRRIVLDPGHGGFFRGSLGVGGLTEAEVNLGVALHLRGLLEARGADVRMTRTDDRDFLAPADSALRSDLAERARIANEFRPDLFVSIHHNADARGAHDVNETQTYYKLGDEGPSLDAAESVHRFLVRNLGIERHRILPGNYFVLRNSEAPALLTEASYVTNPDVESKLALAAKQRLEAEALYLGIAHWFARPRPTIDEFAAVRSTPGAAVVADSVFTDAGPRLFARISGPFDRVAVEVDGRAVPFTLTGATLATAPLALPSGAHVASIDACLAGAGAARRRTIAFRVSRPPAMLRADAFPPGGADAGTVAVRVRVEDAQGLPCPDSLAIRVAAAAAAPGETTVVARDGIAWAYFRRPTGAMPAAFTPRAPGRPRLAVRAAEFRARDERGLRGAWLSRMPGDSALRLPAGDEANLTADAAPWVNRDGFALIARDERGRPVGPGVRGHRPWAGTGEAPERAWVPIAGGALHGRRIVLDPDGGGENDAGTGASGTRAANLNLEVCRALAGFLEAAGAEVRLTRNGDFALSDVERVQISEAFRADRYLRIGHRAEPAMLGHYYSSAGGRRWAERTAAALALLGLAPPPVAEDAQYPLQQTSCPALYASPSRIDDPAAEERYLAPAAVRAEAYALYLGLAREWTDAEWRADSLTVRRDDGAPAAGAAVTFGGAFVLLTDAAGRVRFARTEPGPMAVVVEHPRVRARRVLLDSESGIVVTGSSER